MNFFARRRAQKIARVLDVFKEREYGLEQSSADIWFKTGIHSGSLYPILAELENAGVLVSRWDDTNLEIRGGRRRRLYSLPSPTAGREG